MDDVEEGGVGADPTASGEEEEEEEEENYITYPPHTCTLIHLLCVVPGGETANALLIGITKVLLGKSPHFFGFFQ